ncbi:hypothetical protein ACJMK2_022529, partial [Sinanodonta woodiana]
MEVIVQVDILFHYCDTRHHPKQATKLKPETFFRFCKHVIRLVVRILTVNNGATWGDWHYPDFCAEGSFAVGYKMKIEPRLYSRDGTGLNAILLRCESVNGSLFGGHAGSGEGSSGNWTGWSRCNNQAGAHDFLTSFSLQVEPKQA